MYNVSTTPLHLLSQRITALESLAEDTISLEAFAVLRQLENVFFRLINTFKINITKGFKDFKRGELKAYQDAHHGDLRKLYSGKLNWMNISHISIPIPKSLHRPYLVTAQHVSTLLESAHYELVIKKATQCLDILEKTQIPHTDPNTKSFLNEVKNQKRIVTQDQLLPYLDLKERGQFECAAQDVFSSVADIQKTTDIIMTYEKHFALTLVIQPKLTALEHRVDALVIKLEHGEIISKNYLAELYHLVSMFSTYLDAYSSYIQAAQILEHCFVLTLRKIMSVV